MRKNSQADMTPFNMNKKPGRQNLLLLPLIWGLSSLLVRGRNLKIKKINMENLKPPYLVLSMHQGFSDYYITPLALFPHRASYVSDMEGFANYGRKLYSMAGCIPTRRFAGNVALIDNIRHTVNHHRDIIVIFPEARHSNVGTNSILQDSVGKLIKLLKLPVVVQKLHGSYLSAPIWDEQNSRRVPLESTLEKILTAADIDKLTAGEITDLVNRHFSYDEYRWQYQNRIAIDNPNRAQGLHKVLYRCLACGVEGQMDSSGDHLFCRSCGEQWQMDQYGRLAAIGDPERTIHIPDWYEHQRQQTETQIKAGKYNLKITVKIDALPNEKGFVEMGDGVLEHSREGFRLTFENSRETLYFPTRGLSSVHTEYDYREKGDCLVLSTNDCCYYLYTPQKNLNVARIQFAAEAFYIADQAKRRKSL